MLFEILMVITILLATILSHRDMSTGICHAMLADGTWLLWPCHLHRDPTQYGGKMKACHSLGGKLFHPQLCQPHVTKSGGGCLEGRFKRLTIQVGRYGFNKVEREFRILSL